LIDRSLPRQDSGRSPVEADDEPAPDETKYSSTPWHLVDTWWETGGELRINGKPVEAATAWAVDPKDVPDDAEATAQGKVLVITVGTPVEGRTHRRVDLLGQ